MESPVPTPFWKRPNVWESLELIAAIAALASGIIAVWYKLAGAIWGSGCGVVVLVAKMVQKRLDRKEREEREAYLRRVVGAVLEGLRQEYFSKVEDDDRHNHRVTLFVCDDAPTGKQLTIFQRAGVHKSSPTVWRVNEDEEGQCEGVAGRIWFLGTERTVELPDWADDVGRKAEYAAKGFIGPAQAETLRVKSKVLSGTVVRVFGQRWGVLILDSKGLGVITSAKEHVIKRYAALLGRLLEEADQ
jgi:hypothetical protein